MPHTQQGHLFDLGPDGLGFIIPADQPDQKYAFTVRQIQVKDFEAAGLREGAAVEFHVNEKRQIDRVTSL